MNKEIYEWALDVFAHYNQQFKAYPVQDDENYFIFDWRDSNGSGNLSTRYIVDKKRGIFIITGDAGSCIACWYHSVAAEDIEEYLYDIRYFIGKMQCTTHKYTYDSADAEEDINEIRKEILELYRADNLAVEVEGEEEINEDFDEMIEILSDYNLQEHCSYPSDFIEIMEKYDTDWWEHSPYGERIDRRLYLWVVGYQEGLKSLEEQKNK